LVVPVLLIVGLVACESSSFRADLEERHAGGSCRRATSCATCTPILGCGWCQLPDGTGRCVDDPNDCADEKVFTWNWDPAGCRTPADASAVTIVGDGQPHDAGASVGSSTSDASIDAPDAN
jgi:hypothetical protein